MFPNRLLMTCFKFANCLNQKLCFSCPTMIKPTSTVTDTYGIQGQTHGLQRCHWPKAQVAPSVYGISEAN